MLITLSEELNEKILCEWSGEITDKHAQDFCDVCNAVFYEHFDLDYMHRKYDENLYGKSLIVIVYKDNVPVATEGVWRNDIDDRVAFQLCDFATLPSVRKNGYPLDIFYMICTEIEKVHPKANIYVLPGDTAFEINRALGFATINLYAHIYHGETEDFKKYVPVIDDAYIETFTVKKKGAYLCRLNGKCYLVFKSISIKKLIPTAVILGQVSNSFWDRFEHLSRFIVLLYYTPEEGIFRHRRDNLGKYALGASEQVMDFLPYTYKADGYSLSFNGMNKH